MTALDNFASLRWFAPELILSVGILAILVADLFAKGPSRQRSSMIALGSLALALLATLLTMDGEKRGLFGGLIARDPFTDFFKILFIATTAFVGIAALRSRDTIEYRPGEHQDKESGEFYALALTTAIGMMLMAASTDLLLAFLSLELVSILSYILAGFKRRNRKSSEASLKYVIYGGVASGIMLYGMSLLYGLAGSTNLTTIYQAAQASTSTLTLIVAVVLCLAGFGYKVASVPFHMWCPDVYEGAPTPVTAFFAIGPKAAGFALLIRFFNGAIPAEIHTDMFRSSPWPLILGLIAAATMTLGNLAAINQTNLKRLLAYSSIAHAGYLMLGLCAGNADGQRAMLLYMVTYLFMNLGAFLVIMALADAGLGEDVADYRGLGQRAKFPALVMAISLFSLTGLPPFAGFFGKFYLFAALLAKGGTMNVTLALIAILNSAISLYYYARVLKAMYFEKAESDEPVAIAPIHTWNMGLMAAASLGLWVFWSPLVDFATNSLPQWYPAATRLVAAAAVLP
ncbi:MAG: NADH-quinone oxidoreductase subunit N [Myxococcales bacterium]|nr:NADH-quinone oxidoreductase subunit N [Myxococcales bacterium]